MNLTKAIKEIVATNLIGFGFSYEKTLGSWLFTRTINNNQDFISFEKSGWNKNAIRASFYNEAGSVYSSFFLNRRVDEWHYYDNQESLKDTLKLIVDIIENYGLKWLEENRPVDHSISELKNLQKNELEEELQLFLRSNNLDLQNPMALKSLEELLKQNVTVELIRASGYFLGEVFVKNLGAEWIFDKDQVPYIKNIGGFQGFERNPYKIITRYVNNPENAIIYGHFEAIANTVSNMRKK